MKKLCFSMTIYFITFASFGQNVGIGELSPGAKLTIRGSDAFNKNFLVKTMSGDTSFFIYDRNVFINGYPSSFVSASLTLNNKYFLPLDGAQLAIAASGERSSGGFSNGSLSSIQFYNTNNLAARFLIDSYLGTQGPNYWRVNYISPEAPFNIRSFFHIGQDGYAGFGEFAPNAKMQINHRSSTGVPTLRLHDSSTTAGPILQFSNTGGSDDFQIRSVLNDFNDRMDFFYNNTIVASMVYGGTASLGIGTTNPVDRLHVNTGALHCYTRYTNSATGASSTDGVITGVSGAGTAFFHNYEAAPMYLGTAGINRMMIDASGRVGIGVDPPSEALDVNGNIESSGLLRVTGEVNRPATGSSHLLPVAYGSITPSGGINHSSGNITASRTGVGDYSITITGENYNFANYVTVVTPVSSNSTPIIAHTNSLGGNLLIFIFNIAGSSVDANFSFVVYRQ